MSYIDMIGKTEEEAIAKALAQLGMERDDVSVEILERAKSGFLGMGGKPARVRVTYGPDEAPMEEIVAPVKPVVEAAPVVEKEEVKAKKAEPKPQAKKQQPKQEKKVEVPAIDLPVSSDSNAERITAFLSGLMEHLDSEAAVKVYEEEKGRYKVILEGENLGQLIGRRGETLDAIQQLTNYSVNRGLSKRVRIHIDAEGYRAKREESLQHLALKVAGKVVKYRKDMKLEPMNAYERHVIHAALQDVPKVTTYSTGVEPNRRTVVAYTPNK